MTCLIVDALPVHYHFAYLNSLPKYHKTPPKKTSTICLWPTLLSHSCHRPGGAEDPYHITLLLHRVYYFQPRHGSRCFQWRKRGTSPASPYVHPTSEAASSSLWALTHCQLLHPQVCASPRDLRVVARCRAAFLLHPKWQKQRDRALVLVRLFVFLFFCFFFFLNEALELMILTVGFSLYDSILSCINTGYSEVSSPRMQNIQEKHHIKPEIS